MNCQELHQHIQNSPEHALNFGHFSAEMLAHVNGCSDCKNFVGQRRELAMTLQRIREAVPAFPEILDTAVLMAFRSHAAAAERDKSALHKKTGRVKTFSYSAAVLATAGILIFFSLPSKQTARRIETAQALRPTAANEVLNRVSDIGPRIQIKQTNAHQGVTRQKPRRHAAAVDHRLLTSGFTSLMYCDRLSCAGDMEIVRMQVFPSMLGFPAGRTDAAGTVLADVLVGPDGIARGIRLEQ